MKKLFLGIAFLTIMCSCSGINKQKDTLDGKTYILLTDKVIAEKTEVSDKKIEKKTDKNVEKKAKDKKEEKENKRKRNIERDEITLSFKDDQVFGNGGVNRYFGKYKAKRGKITIKYLASTKMAGPKKMMEKEQDYLAKLNDVTKYKIKKDELTLTTSKGDTLKYKEAETDKEDKDKKDKK